MAGQYVIHLKVFSGTIFLGAKLIVSNLLKPLSYI
jgi:hypothetical protein